MNGKEHVPISFEQKKKKKKKTNKTKKQVFRETTTELRNRSLKNEHLKILQKIHLAQNAEFIYFYFMMKNRRTTTLEDKNKNLRTMKEQLKDLEHIQCGSN